MGLLPPGPDRDRGSSSATNTAEAAPEGTLSHGGRSGADLRDQLAQVGADAVGAGLVVGSGGNLSAREPAATQAWASASGRWLDRLTRPDFVRVGIADGTPVDPSAPVSSEIALHLHTYRARPDINVVVHLHPQSVLLLDALGESIRLSTTDHAYYVGRVARVGFFPPGSVALAEAAAAAAGDGADCIILAHHGCSVLADSVEMAHKRVRNLEEAAQLTYRALLLGRRDLPECPPEFLAQLGRDKPGTI